MITKISIIPASLFLIIIFLMIIPAVGSLGSTNYNISSPTLPSGAGNASSSNFKTGLAIEEITGNLTSSSFATGIGFYYTLPLNVSVTNITLMKGWNLISLEMRKGDTNTDRNISIVRGWNLIGYSSNNNLSIENLTFTNSSGSRFTWNNAVANNKVQAYLSYYDSSPAIASQRKYKYVATSDLEMDDTKLRKGKGYWLYSNEAGNLTLPSVGGSYGNESYAYSKLRFSNGTTEVNISQAGANNWIDLTLYYWGLGKDGYKFLLTNSSSSLESWRGYFIWSNQDNITLIRQN